MGASRGLEQFGGFPVTGMKVEVFQHMTLMDLIVRLRELDEHVVVNLAGGIYSYRGFYERGCVSPDVRGTEAWVLSDILAADLGGTMQGWKGGDFPVHDEVPMYVAEWGDTGPMLMGIHADGTLILAIESW
jgi:hypothetical protein